MLCLGSHQRLHRALMLTPLTTFVCAYGLTYSNSWLAVFPVEQNNSRKLDQSQWGRAAETVSGATAGNRPHAASARDQNSAPAGGSSARSFCVAETDTHCGADLQIMTGSAWCVLPGGPACTQRGRADGLAGGITVPHLPPLPRHPHGGHPRGWEASQNPVTFQHPQRQVQKH